MKITDYAPIVKIDVLMEELKKDIKEDFTYETDDFGCVLIFKDGDETVEVDFADYLENVSRMLGTDFASYHLINNDFDEVVAVALIPEHSTL